MRISDWSSAVCSADLGAVAPSDPTIQQLPETMELPRDAAAPEADLVRTERPRASLYLEVANAWEVIRRRGQQPTPELIAREIGPDMLARFLNQFPGSEALFGKDSDRHPVEPPALPPYPRSEEHTSELQSLMRTPYAVFCL